MKKIISLSIVLVLLAAAATAQRGPGDRIRKQRLHNHYRQITPLERFDLRKDVFRYEVIQRRARRDGVVTPFERRRLHKTKTNIRQEAFRYKHNNRRRVI